VVDASVDRPLKIGGSIVVLAPATPPAFRVRHIFSSIANWMDLLIQSAALEQSWHQDRLCYRTPTFGHLANTKLTCSALQ
jgi:hypothetical protein